VHDTVRYCVRHSLTYAYWCFHTFFPAAFRFHLGLDPFEFADVRTLAVMENDWENKKQPEVVAHVQVYSTPRCLKKKSIMLTSGFGARPAFGAMATTCMPTSSARFFKRTTCAGW